MPEAMIGLLGVLLGTLITLACQWAMASRQQTDLFRLASVEKRLEINQQAFALWQKLVSVVYNKNESAKVVVECQEWWYNNCLYLQPKVREAFRACYMGVWDYDPKDKLMRDEVWPEIMAPGRLIPAAVNLPPIGNLDEEVKKIQEERKKLVNQG
jgi:hypothetical protein